MPLVDDDGFVVPEISLRSPTDTPAIHVSDVIIHDDSQPEDIDLDDAPPSFPLPNSAQRAQPSTSKSESSSGNTGLEVDSTARSWSNLIPSIPSRAFWTLNSAAAGAASRDQAGGPAPASRATPKPSTISSKSASSPPQFTFSVSKSSTSARISPIPSVVASGPDSSPASSLSLVGPASSLTGEQSAGGALQPPTSTLRPPTKSRKVALAPGHSPLDWARLKSSGVDLRSGFTMLARIPLSEVAKHNKPNDAWSVFYGKVYNITPYIPFHPGGVTQLMRVAGRDGTKLFALTHSWVNLEFTLEECMLGFLVPEPS